MERRRNPQDGSEFVVVWAADLVDAGAQVQRTVAPDVRVIRRDGCWLAVELPFGDDRGGELMWMPEEVYFDDLAKDRECALTAAVRALNPNMDSREDVLRLADRLFEWLRSKAPRAI